MTEPTGAEYVNLKAAAKLAGVSYVTVRRLVRSGDLTAYRRGVDRRSLLVSLADLQRLTEPVAA